MVQQLDGSALPIKKLKGTEPVESLNFSKKSLGVASAVVIALLIRVNGSLTSLNLAENNLILDDIGFVRAAEVQGASLNVGDKVIYEGSEMIVSQGTDSYGHIKIRPVDWLLGIHAIAKALRVNGSLTCVDVHHNNIVGDGASQLSAAVLGNTKIKVFNKVPVEKMRADSYTELNLSQKGMGVVGGMVVAGLLPVMGSLKSMNLFDNRIGPEGANAIAEALKVNGSVRHLVLKDNRLGPEGARHLSEGLRVNKSITDLDISRGDDYLSAAIQAEGAKYIADMLLVNGSITKLNLNNNHIQYEGVVLICEALKRNKDTNLSSLNLGRNELGPAGAREVAAMIAFVGSLREVCMLKTSVWNLCWSFVCGRS